MDAADNSRTAIGQPVTISCERCRRRKIKCDHGQPCARCRRAGSECVRGTTGEKQRPIPKSYVQALESHVASLELFISKLAESDHEQRDELLASFITTGPTSSSQASAHAEDDAEPSRARSGQLRKLRAGNVTQFYGGTSLFQIHVTENNSVVLPEAEPGSLQMLPSDYFPSAADDMGQNVHVRIGFSPRDDIPQRLMATFFREQYQYHMCIYREYFLRDYDTGHGRYYSDLLLYAICSFGALLDDDPSLRMLSPLFASHAEALLYPSLDAPNLTTLQALLLLGQRAVGLGHASKGWLFCGMAFRLAHEMGLHLDPNNWKGSIGQHEPDVDREILRRLYWAAFIVDKQLSLFFGRPPALYPSEADVRNAIRLPYPPDADGLLDTYVSDGIPAASFEDGIAFVGSFIYRAELCKIIHNMITDLFENRRSVADSALTATTVRQIHVSLTRWQANLPSKLHWTQWTVGPVQPSILHLHMVFHTAMMILHRPPRHLYRKPGMATSEDVEICYESMNAVIRLMRSYARHYRYRNLPLDFVHTLSTVAGTVLMKRFLDNAAWDDSEISKSLSFILEAMDEVKDTWPCIAEIRECIVQTVQNATAGTANASPGSFDFMPELGIEGGFFY